MHAVSWGAEPQAAQRAQLARERREVDQRFAREREECARRFAVTACVEQARREQRSARERLDAQLTALDEAQRRQRAAQAKERVDRRIRERDARLAAPPGETEARPERSATGASAAPHRMPDQERRPAARRGVDPAARALQEQRALERSAEREREALKHREAVERRNAGRRPAAPLPLPSASAASAGS